MLWLSMIKSSVVTLEEEVEREERENKYFAAFKGKDKHSACRGIELLNEMHLRIHSNPCFPQEISQN